MADISTNQTQMPKWITPALFSVTIFLSASLLFFVQPLFTKVVLPHVGGAPAVWTTAILFFQTVLIGGYLYAHIITRYLSVRVQIGLHLVLWSMALVFLPLAVAEGWSYDAEKSTAGQTLMLFAGGVGLPFAVLSANAPLIQSWYARSGGYSADDPYFLYGASNLGSLIALLAFPLVAEPLFGTTQIGWGWTVGFWTMGALLLSSGLMAVGRELKSPEIESEGASAAPTLTTRLNWGLIAFVPSSLMLAVTTKLSTDLGSIPLIWVVPLALFLLTFVLVFTNRPIASVKTLRLGYLLGLAWLVGLFSNGFEIHVTMLTAAVTVVAFFLAALYVHALLYAARPSPKYLTTFYVTMSIGGALGGFFNSIIAPNLFNELHEGAITVAIAAIFLLDAKSRLSPLAMRVSGVLAVTLLLQGAVVGLIGYLSFGIVVAALMILIATTIRTSRQAQAFAMIAILVAGNYVGNREQLLFVDRSFFGTHKISERDGLRLYTNGSTTHGAQRIVDLTAERPEPQSYYHSSGPMAQVVSSLGSDDAESVGIVGLGVGALACYRKPGQDWHFYEIDSLVDQIARNPDYFTFVSQCAPDAPTHLGDARMVLAEQDGLTYDILLVDAYSSDSVPIHLSTVEAVEVYLERLEDDGLLIFHISNRFYDMRAPLGRIAKTLGLQARVQYHAPDKSVAPGALGSLVVAMARSEEALGAAGTDPRWRELRSDGGRVWTDDYANVLEILIH